MTYFKKEPVGQLTEALHVLRDGRDERPLTGKTEDRRACQHDSTRIDGTLDCNCLRCGADGYWHDGHRHDRDHPSGKVLFVVACAAQS